MGFNRRRTRAGLAVTAAVTIALGVGIGAAGASGRQDWWGRGQQQPAPTSSTPTEAAGSTAAPAPGATQSTTPTDSPASAAPAPATTATPTATTPATTVAPSSAAPKPAAPATAPPRTSAPVRKGAGTTAAWAPPPANANFDYQIGGAYAPPSGVTVVSRDSEASPAAGIYNICYVNAFQAQPGAESWWKTNHPNLLLRDANGNLVVDEDWDELMLDFSTEAKRTALTRIVGGWIDTCASKGFKAIEPDNLDSYTRSKGLLTRAQAVSYAASLSAYAHSKGLAVAQKNLAELSTADARKAGFDFAVAEECATWNECDAYTATYGNHVIVIEYTESGYTKACRSHGSTLSVVLRDLDVTTPGSRSYVRKAC
ncbi:endo alpha-1,4 polygalactosaminidase [Micromonospora sp. WMMA1923]|uniref:endo alpha-1,4 polygalactosaminidase n=1 Tax=Micromonospora sp. WMMA1923 TaxID=3404125 RepID=UPI003B96749E